MVSVRSQVGSLGLLQFPKLLATIRQGHERYEKLRKLNPMQFTALHKRAMHGDKKFDELVDDLVFKIRLV